MNGPADLMEERKRRLAAVDAALERGITDIEAGRGTMAIRFLTRLKRATP